MAAPRITLTPNYKARANDFTNYQDISYTAAAIGMSLKSQNYFVPVGSVFPFAGTTDPARYLICDGRAISRSAYKELFDIIGVAYGPGDGSTTFNIPNMKGNVAVGRDAAQTEFDTLGETGGYKTHTLTIAQMPAHSHGADVVGNGITSSAGVHTHVITDPGHNHAITDPGHNHAITDPGHFHSMGTETVENGSGSIVANNDEGIPGPNPVAGETKTTGITINTNTTGISVNTNTTGVTNQNAGAHTHNIGSQGGGQEHNNLQPYLVLNYIIKYT